MVVSIGPTRFNRQTAIGSTTIAVPGPTSAAISACGRLNESLLLGKRGDRGRLANLPDCEFSDQSSTPGCDRVKGHFPVLASEHCKLASSCLASVCAAHTKIVAYVKDPLSTFSIREGLTTGGVKAHRKRLTVTEESKL